MRTILLSVASVAVLLCASCQGGNKGNAGATQGTGVAVETRSSAAIAYIVMDTLMANYDMYKELKGEFEVEANAVESELLTRSRNLEKALGDAKSKYERGLMTSREASMAQEELQKREVELYQFRDKKQQELAEKDLVLTNKIITAVNEYVTEFNKDYRYSMILTSSGGAPVIHADPSLDITKQVVEGLNKAYAANKKKK